MQPRPRPISAPQCAFQCAGTTCGAPGITGDVSVHSGTRVVTNTETTYQTKFLSIIGITALTVTGHAEVDVNRAVEGVAQ